MLFFMNRITTLSTSADEKLRARLAIDFVASDETKQRLRMSLGSGPAGDALRGHCQNSPHVFVSRRTLRVVFDSFAISMPWISPPCAMLATTSGALHSVMFALPGIGSHRAYRKLLAIIDPDTIGPGDTRPIDDQLKLRTLDGAGSNPRLNHYEFLRDEQHDHRFGAGHHCSTHGSSLAMGATSNQCFPKLVETMSSTSLFMAMGAYYLRMLYVVPALVDVMTNPMPFNVGTPSPPDMELWNRCIEGLISILVITHVSGLVPRDLTGRTEGKSTYLDDLRFLFSLWNYKLGGNGTGDGWIHRCFKFGEDCHDACCNSLAVLKRKLRFAVMRVVLRRRPPAAAVSRWTTTGPATDFYILACVTNILRPLMEFAQRAVTKSAGAPGEAVAAEPDEYACDFSWHEVASKRLLRTLNMLRDVDCTLKVLCFGIVVASFRYLVQWMFARTHSTACTFPAMIDWHNEAHSPYTKVMQYLRSIIRSHANNRFVAVMVLSGHSTRSEFLRSQCFAAKTLHKSSLVASAWCFLKLLSSRLLPFSLCRQADPRISADVLESERRDFFQRRHCRLDWACGRKIRKRLPSANDLAAPRNKRLCRGLGDTPLHNGPVECLHARNQTRVHAHSTWESLCAEFVNAEAVSFTQEHIGRQQHDHRMLLEPVDPAADVHGPPSEDTDDMPVPKGMYAKDVYRMKKIKEMQSQLAPGEKLKGINVVGAAFRKKCSDEFDSAMVSAAERASCQRIASRNAAQARPAARNKVVSAETGALLPLPAAAAAAAAAGASGAGGGASLQPHRQCRDMCDVMSRLGLDTTATVLAPDQQCGVCRRLGIAHECRPDVHLPAMMRDNSGGVESVLTRQDGNADRMVSQLPLSASRFEAEKQTCPFGTSIAYIGKAFSGTVLGVGRDLGGVPDKMPARGVCRFLCLHVLDEPRLSLVSQLKQLFIDFVDAHGDLTGIVDTQPSVSLWHRHVVSRIRFYKHSYIERSG